MANSDSDTDNEDKDEDSSVADDTVAKSNSDEDALRTKARGLHVRLVRNLPRLSESSGAAHLSRRLIQCLGGDDPPKNANLSEARFFLEELLKILRDEKQPDGLTGFGDDDDENNGGKLEANAVPELLATARVIFCTLSTAGTSLMKRTRRVDDWIVDEAAAATETELLIPLHLDPMRLLAVGDPMQLPASVASPSAVEWGLGRSLHERLTVDLGQSQTMLDVQYRMKPEISEFPSNQFYDGRLTNGENVQSIDYGSSNPAIGSRKEDEKGQLLQTTPPWCFFQVDGKEQQSHSGSYYNTEEASAVVAMLKIIQKRSSLTEEKRRQTNNQSSCWWTPEKVRIITFYSAQVATLKQMLRREGMPQVLVATVDSSQGCEADIIILSFVRSSRAGFLADDRRINVALTRAKYKLICLGNARESPWATSSPTMKKMVEDAQQRGCMSFALATKTQKHPQHQNINESE